MARLIVKSLPHPLLQRDAAIGLPHILDALRPPSAQLLAAELICVGEDTSHQILLHRLLVQQRGHPAFELVQQAVQIGLDGGREKQSSVVGAEVVQIKVHRPLNEVGDAPAPVLLIPALQNGLFSGDR